MALLATLARSPGSLVLFAFDRSPARHRRAVSPSACHLDRAQSAGFEIQYFLGVDGLSLVMILLTTFLFVVSVLISWNVVLRPKEYFAWLLVLETGVLGVFTALDLILFFLFWELELLPMYLLISIWGTGRKEYSAMKFVLFTIAGSAFMLVGFLVLAFSANPSTFDMQVLSQADQAHVCCRSRRLLRFIFAAFAVKLPVVPAAHLAARRAHRRADRGQRDPRGRAAEDGRLRHPAHPRDASCRTRRTTTASGSRRSPRSASSTAR